MDQQNIARLGALAGKWNVPAPEKLKAVLQSDGDVESSFYTSDLGLASSNGAAFEIYRDDEGAHRWRLRGEDGTVLAESGASYPARASCRKAIRLVRKIGSSAEVKEPA